jgi:hypothetical protein
MNRVQQYMAGVPHWMPMVSDLGGVRAGALTRYSVFEPTGRANARPMTGSVDAGSHSNQVYADCVALSAAENASK